jgi:non-ribosomal peptide synthetase component F
MLSVGCPVLCTHLEQQLSGDSSRLHTIVMCMRVRCRSSLLRRLDETLHADVRRSRAESVALIERWNGGRASYPDTACLHELFQQSAAAHPDAVAIVYQGKEVNRLTYYYIFQYILRILLL